MRTIGTPTRHEIEIKRSRFIGSCARTDCEEEARKFIATVRSLFPDARHHCTAFLIHNDAGPDTARSSDDGEPAGTAGNPMLSVLSGSGLTNITCVVTRYFGGIKLGTGGLVKAYSQAVQEVLDRAKIVRVITQETYEADFPLSEAGRIEAKITQNGYEILDRTFSRQATLRFSCLPQISKAQIESYLSSLTSREEKVTTDPTITREIAQ